MDPDLPLGNIALQSRVVAALRRSGTVDSEHLGVSAHEGVVTISGSVVGSAERRAVKALAIGVDGVRDVVNEVRVRKLRSA